jgi:hypothetical protein
MAGLVGFTSAWETFTDSWESVLKEPPSVPYFRLADFRNPAWRATHDISEDEAVKKINRLSSCLTNPPILFSVCVSVQKDDYRDIVTNSGILTKLRRNERLLLNTPYSFCFQNVIGRTVQKLVDELSIMGDVVDFVFDRNEPLFDAANTTFRTIRDAGNLPKGWREALGDAEPKNDETLLPLQAADLLAGVFKDHCSSPYDSAIKSHLLSISGNRNPEHNITLHARPHRLNKFVASLKAGAPWIPIK